MKLPPDRDHLCDVNVDHVKRVRCSFKAEWGVVGANNIPGKKKGKELFDVNGPRVMCCDFHLAEVMRIMSMPFALVYRFNGEGEER